MKLLAPTLAALLTSITVHAAETPCDDLRTYFHEEGVKVEFDIVLRNLFHPEDVRVHPIVAWHRAELKDCSPESRYVDLESNHFVIGDHRYLLRSMETMDVRFDSGQLNFTWLTGKGFDHPSEHYEMHEHALTAFLKSELPINSFTPKSGRGSYVKVVTSCGDDRGKVCLPDENNTYFYSEEVGAVVLIPI